MVDLIDRAALLEALEYDPEKRAIVQPKSTFGIILSAPAVDAVEVVRCKDCKSWTRHSGVASYSPTGACSTWADTTLGVDYCSYGERRTDATD